MNIIPYIRLMGMDVIVNNAISWEMIRTILEYAGYAATLVVVGSIIGAVVLWARGLLPVLLRLGNGLSKRKIAVLARGDSLTGLVQLLSDSKLFEKNNILRIANERDLGAIEHASVILLFWPDWNDHIEEILASKRDSDALIVYAPQEQGFIPKEIMALLESKRNVIVNNFRGRLLNDLVISMVTTSYERR